MSICLEETTHVGPATRPPVQRARFVHRSTAARRTRKILSAVNVNQLIVDLAGTLEDLVGLDITLAFAFNASACWVAIDRRSLEQAIVNLVIHARDAMPRGGVITLSTRNLSQPVDAFAAVVARLVVIDVSDGSKEPAHAARFRIILPLRSWTRT